MKRVFPDLPYAYDALEPYISEQTLRLHHGKHHRKYFDTMAEMIEGSPLENATQEDIIRAVVHNTEHRKLFNNVAQSWNHEFFWNCMSPQGGGVPSKYLAGALEREYGDMEGFREAFIEAAVDEFGSGWVWLVNDAGTIRIVHTTDAINPMIHDKTPLLTCDVWEHAYYLDYQNRRSAFVEAFLGHLVDWSFVERQLDPKTRLAA